MKPQNINLLLVKIDRVAAWVLLFSITLYFLSGYGITKGIINIEKAIFLHKNLLPIIAISSFSIHSFLGIRIFLLRNNIWNKISGTILSLIYISIFSFFLYLEIFYKTPTNNLTTTGPQDTIQNKTDQPKVFNSLELSKYNGKNGESSYVAVDGVVYDVTKLFKDGTHFGHNAGQELTKAFFSEHVKSQITKYPAVGIYESN